MLAPIEPPKANPENLLGLMRDAYAAKVVIPEFQRSFVWGREDIEEVLVSVLQGYFIGTFLMLDTVPEKPMFPFRPVEGLEEINPDARPKNHPTVRLALDGQQRITSLFYAFYEPPVPLKYSRYPYRFFFRLDLALDANPDDAVYGISLNDRRGMSDMQKRVELDQAVPFSLFLDSSRFYKWFYQAQKFLTTDRDKQLIESYYDRLQKFMVPVVALSPETGKDNIVNIFERINRTGVTLSLFDLAVARLYLKGVLLRDLWEKLAAEHKAIAEIIKPEFVLKIITLALGKEPRKATLLDVIDELDEHSFEQQWEVACEYLVKAHTRISKPMGGYGAYDPGWIPYSTMIVPLAALLRAVEERKGGEAFYRMVDKWYWSTVFTQRYDSAVDTKSHSDLKEMCQAFEDGTPIPGLQGLAVDGIALNTDEKRSAIYRGLMCLVVTRGANDFLTGQAANLGECEDDHIFPRAKFGKHPSINSILNRTLITPESNKVKSDKKPSEFLPLFLEKHAQVDANLRKTLESHFINDEAIEAMKRDDMDGFLKAREREFATHLGSILSQ
jgi:hypothetical protein